MASPEGRDMRRGYATTWLLVSALVVACASAAMAAAPLGAQIAKEGVASHGVPACQACHGADGAGQPAADIPRLAGLNGAYLDRQLAAFATGVRRNPIMGPMAMGLTPAERTAVSAFFAALPVKAGPADPSKAGDPIRGQALAQVGRWAADIPPCASCHGVDGLGVGSAVPPLAAQPAGYIESALTAWREGDRSGDPLGLMGGISKRLSPADIHDAAAYFSAQPPRRAAPAAKPGRRPS
jgi:cytochrome c553